MMESTISKHISIDAGICGGKPCITGTRIRVWDVRVWHDLRGQSPEEIVAAFPQLSLADVHAALAHYLDHREELEQQMTQAHDEVASMEAAQGPTKFTRLRDQLLRDKDAHEDSFPSG